MTNLPLPNRSVVRFYNKGSTVEQWIKEGKQVAHGTCATLNGPSKVDLIPVPRD